MKNCQFHNTLTVRTLLRVFMGSIQERRALFGCDMNTWEPKIHEKLPISQHIDRQDLATSVHGEFEFDLVALPRVIPRISRPVLGWLESKVSAIDGRVLGGHVAACGRFPN